MSKNRAAASGLGADLRAARKSAMLRQIDLAERAQLAERTIYQAEQGTGRFVSFATAISVLSLEVVGRGLPPGPHLGARLGLLRQRQRKSVRKLAEITGLSPISIASAESGALGTGLSTLELMAVGLGIALHLREIGEEENYWAGAAVSATHDGWTTPTDLLERLYPLVGGRFDLDPCSPVKDGRAAPVKARNYYTLEQDGLKLPWYGAIFMNPPFGNSKEWVRKARSESETGRVSPLIGLLAARVDTGWWHSDVASVADIWFLRGRLKFGGSNNSAPFPCAIVAWAAGDNIRQEISSALPNAWHVPKSITSI